MVHAGLSRGHGGHMSGLDGNRIAAGAGAISINVVLLMLLMVPLRIVAPAPDVTRTEVDWLPAVPEPRIEPIPVPVEQPRVAPQPAATPTPRQVTPVPSPQPVVDAVTGDLPALPATPDATPAVPASATSVAVMSGAALRSAAAPPPPSPRRALRAGIEGTELLEVLVDVDGTPLEVSIVGSSGERELDRAALRHVLAHWRFQPAVRDGRPVQAIGRVPITFSLR